MKEYRIKYNAGAYHSDIDNYHYYMADSAVQALQFHDLTRLAKKLNFQTISVEKYCRYSEKWILEIGSSGIDQYITHSGNNC
jgi:hypothetical protein